MTAVLPSPQSERESFAIALAHTTAQRWFGRGSVVTDDDLLGAALLGAAQALDRYDARQGVAFRTYAITRIRGEIQEELRRGDHLDRHTRAGLREAAGEHPNWLQPPISLDVLLSRWEWDTATGEQIADARVDVEAEVLERLEPRVTEDALFSAALGALDAEEREVVEWLFWQDGTLTEWCERQGCVRTTGVRRRDRALAKLGRRLGR